MPNVGQELLNVPLPEMVTKLALGIAEAQTKLDLNSTEVAKFMANTKIKLPSIATPAVAAVPAVPAGPGGNPPAVAAVPATPAVLGPDIEFPLIALGFFPGFYQFTEALVEVKMAITMATSTSAQIGVTAKAGFGCFSASVNASYSRKYDYKVEGSSLLRVKLNPVPPPQILQDYMDAFINGMSGK
jgi:hypothetical protein